MHKIYFLNSNQKRQLLEKPNEIWNYLNSLKLKPYYMENPKKVIYVESYISYSETHLHIIVKTNQTSLKDRDRAYQHGDGLHFVLAKPKKNNELADEFFVIGISPLANNWMKKFIWYKNIDLAMTPLEKTEVNTISLSDSTYIIVNIPFDEIYPIKGLINQVIGFNISYVEALKQGTNVYIFKKDSKIQSEQSLRDYHMFEFEEPKHLEDFLYQMKLNTKHSTYKKPPLLELAFYSSNEREMELKILSEEKILFIEKINVKKGLNQCKMDIDINNLEVKKHIFIVELIIDNKMIRKCLEFYLYDEKDFKLIGNKINEMPERASKFLNESIVSLKFYYQKLMKQFFRIKPYEDFDSLINLKEELETKIRIVSQGQPLFIEGRDIQLGFLSMFDQTIQPYTLYVPQNFDLKNNPKLLILLHGSGSDDTSIKNNPYHFKLAEETNTIIVAPFARGTSHFYCTKEARYEVIEITKKMADLFSIDKNNILLGGFSMGGYGVYRIYDESKELYKGLIVVSGHPSLGKFNKGKDYAKGDHYNKFANIPMIIFHGTEDRNCRFDEVKSFCDKIQRINTQCQVVYKEGIGHSGIISEWYTSLLSWFKNNQFI